MDEPNHLRYQPIHANNFMCIDMSANMHLQKCPPQLNNIQSRASRTFSEQCVWEYNSNTDPFQFKKPPALQRAATLPKDNLKPSKSP